VPLRAGVLVVGVRADTQRTAALVREVFADRYAAGLAPPANFSLVLAAEARGAPQELHRLHVGHRATVRSRSVVRTLEALGHELDLVRLGDARPLRLRAVVLVRDGAATVLPERLRDELAAAHRSLDAGAYVRVDRRLVDIDAATGTITVPDVGPWRAAPPDAGPFRAAGFHHRDEPRCPVGTFPIARWVAEVPELSLAGRVVAAAEQLVGRRGQDVPRLLRDLAALLAPLPAAAATTRADVLRLLGER
jgi:hypothetical protein